MISRRSLLNRVLPSTLLTAFYTGESLANSTTGMNSGKGIDINHSMLESKLSSIDKADLIDKEPLTGYRKIGNFTSGCIINNRNDAVLNSDGFYYINKLSILPIAALSGSSPDQNWVCVGLLNGFEIEDLRNWGDISNDADILPILNIAYEKTQSFVLIPPGKYRMVLKDTYDPGWKSTYPIGLRMTRQGIDIVFSTGASIYIDAVSSEKYAIFEAYYAHNSSIINPTIIGDAEKHLGIDGEWGFGIRNYNSGNFNIRDPKISYCWGDGIYWLVDDITLYGGAISGVGVYKKCRRQGISVISCRGLFIEDSTGIEISGAPKGPCATIDVEPNTSKQFIIGLSIGKVSGFNNKGPAFQASIHRLISSSSPVDITVNDVNSISCLRCIGVRCDGVYGHIDIKNVTGRDSLTQDFRTLKWTSNCQINIGQFLSINPNRVKDKSSKNNVAIGIYNDNPNDILGGINIEKLTILSPDFKLKYPIAIVNNAGGNVGRIRIGQLIYDSSQFFFKEIYNPAGAEIDTNTIIYRDFLTSGKMDNKLWANGITNMSAVVPLTVIVPAGYGYDGMKLSLWNNGHSSLNIIFTDLLNSQTSGIKSTSQGKAILSKQINTWVIDSIKSNAWSSGGTGRYAYGLNEGGETADRPINPMPWQKYYDTTLGYETIFRQDTQTWVKTSG